MIREALDAVVIGGGPAGAAASAELARRGRTVVLLERDRGTVARLCGEFLSPDAVGSLVELGAADEIGALGPPVIRRWRLASRSAEVGRQLPAPALGVSRSSLDPALRAFASRCGAGVHEGARVVSVRSEGALWRVMTSGGDEWLARGTIGAVGRSSRITGMTAPESRRPSPWLAMKAHFRGDVDREAVQLFALGGAYVGVAAVNGDEVNVCFLARLASFRRAGGAEDLLHAGAARNPRWREVWSALDRVSRWVSASGGGWTRRQPSGDGGTLLAGDAAAQVAPFLGEGLAMAMESGRLAARALDGALDGRTGEGLRTRYARDWSARFHGRLRAGRALHSLLLSERCADAAVRLARLRPSWCARIVARTRSRDLVGRANVAVILGARGGGSTRRVPPDASRHGE